MTRPRTTPRTAPRPPAPRYTQAHFCTSRPCFVCGQAGQPVLPVTLTLEATAATPDDWPDQVQVDTYLCIDEATCERVAAGRRGQPAAASLIQ